MASRLFTSFPQAELRGRGIFYVESNDSYCSSVNEMMTNDEIFRNEILENPADDSLRMIFVDWLEEYGTVEEMGFAAFIRAQLNGRITYVRSSPKKPYRFVENHREFVAKCPYWANWVEYRGGFVERISCKSYNIGLLGRLKSKDFIDSSPVRVIFLSDLRNSGIRIEKDWLAHGQPWQIRVQSFRNSEWIQQTYNCNARESLCHEISDAIFHLWSIDGTLEKNARLSCKGHRRSSQ